MDRRAFLRSTGAIASLSLAACRHRAPDAADPTAKAATSVLDPSASELRAMLDSGRTTSRALVEAYLARIDAMNLHGPKLHALIETNPDALAIAHDLDSELKNKGIRSPLHGIPVVVKDNLDTADRMMTTAGSLALVGSRPARDAFVVSKLRAAGAVLIGKSNLSEWANIRSSQSTSGWSARGGLCKNPYVLDRSASGSSSGSAAAVAAGLSAIAIGTETDGSILSPSSTCGLVGIKPTVGLVSRAGIVPISHSQDTAGPMTRTVTDAAMVLTAIAGADARDVATTQAAPHAVDFTKFLDQNALQGARLGVARKYFGSSPALDAVMEHALAVLRDRGATLVDVEMPSLDHVDEAELEVLLTELKNDLQTYFASLAVSPVRTLAEVVEFDVKHADREMPHFGQDLFDKALKKGALDDAKYLEALAACRKAAREDGIDAVLTKEKLDAVVAPTGQPAWTIDFVNGDHFTMSSTTPAAVAGYPSITVPAGFVGPLPVGLSFFGAAFAEPRLIALAYAFEQATRARRPPSFLATIALD